MDDGDGGQLGEGRTGGRTRSGFRAEEEAQHEGGDMGDHDRSHSALPPSAANYRDELLHDSPFPRNRSTR